MCCSGTKLAASITASQLQGTGLNTELRFPAHILVRVSSVLLPSAENKQVV